MTVLEIVEMRLDAGAEEEAFTAMNERFQREVAPSLPGLRWRGTARMPNGWWRWVTWYSDMESAIGAVGADKSTVTGRLMLLIDMYSMECDRSEVILD